MIMVLLRIGLIPCLARPGPVMSEEGELTERPLTC